MSHVTKLGTKQCLAVLVLIYSTPYPCGPDAILDNNILRLFVYFLLFQQIPTLHPGPFLPWGVGENKDAKLFPIPLLFPSSYWHGQ